MSVGTRTYTRTRTEVYVSAKIAYAIQVILAELGLGAEAQHKDWDDVEHAASVWMGEQALKTVTLEVYKTSTNALIATFDVDVDYSLGEPSMRHDAELARLAARKVKQCASTSSIGFRVLMDNEPWRSDVPGWSPTTSRDASGLTRRTIGELARGPGIVSELSYRV
jgi:Bacterial HORMA domain 2